MMLNNRGCSCYVGITHNIVHHARYQVCDVGEELL